MGARGAWGAACGAWKVGGRGGVGERQNQAHAPACIRTRTHTHSHPLLQTCSIFAPCSVLLHLPAAAALGQCGATRLLRFQKGVVWHRPEFWLGLSP